MRRLLLAAIGSSMITTTAAAQLPGGMQVQAGPQIVQYRFRAPVDETVTEVAVPLFAVVPLGRALSVDVGTAWAQSRVEYAGGSSSIAGLTDTQLRANYTIGTDFLILTAGVNLPTGRSTVAMDELVAASRIGNDFLGFPISNMGTGTAVTGGVAVARAAGAWNVGAGGSVRVASAFEPVRPDTGALPRYQPGNEYKVRLGADRTIGAGQVALGLTYSKFGQDDFAGSLYNTGDRYLGQVGYSTVAPVGTLTLSLWNLYRGTGQLMDGADVPWDNITNASTTLSMRTASGVTIEPNLQLRSWLQAVAATESEASRTERSMLAELGVRGRVALGAVEIFPGAGYTIGALAAGADRHARLNGFRGSLGIRVR